MTLQDNDKFIVNRLGTDSVVTTYQAIATDPSMASSFGAWFDNLNWSTTNPFLTVRTLQIGAPLDTNIFTKPNTYWLYDFGVPGCIFGYDESYAIKGGLIQISTDGQTYEDFATYDNNLVNIRIPTRYAKLWPTTGADTRNCICQSGPVPSTLYNVTTENLMTKLQDTDLMLVSRDGVPYKATGEEIKNSLGTPNINPGNNDFVFDPAPESGTGTQADPYILKGQTADPWGASLETIETITIIGQPPETSVVWTDNSVDAGTRFAQVSGETTDANGTWTGKLDYADIPASTETTTYVGNLNIGLVYFRWTVVQTEITDEPTEVTNVSLIESSPAEGNRFTGESFVASSQVTDGLPIATKTIDAHVDGTLSRQVKFDEPLESNVGTNLTFANDADMEGLATGDTVNQTYDFTEPLESTSVDTSGEWTKVAATPFETVYAVTYGNGKFVATCSGSTNPVMYSTDGITWTQGSMPDAEAYQQWYGLAYGGGYYITTAWYGTNRAMRSVDNGLTWSIAPLTDTIKNKSINGIAYGGGIFLAVSSSGLAVRTDNNGVSFTDDVPIPQWSWYDIACNGASTFVAVGASPPKAAVTDDYGYSWTEIDLPVNMNSITYGNGRFVAVSQNGSPSSAIYSDDGITWYLGTGVSTEIPSGWQCVTYGDGKFVALGTPGMPVMYSYDGIYWEKGMAPDAFFSTCAYGDGKFIAGSDTGVYASTTGLGLSVDLTFPTGTNMTALAAGDGVSQEDPAGSEYLKGLTTLYTGARDESGQLAQTIVNGINLTDNDGLVWIKGRSLGYPHVLTDTIRGTESQIFSDSSVKEDTSKIMVTDFRNNGFDLGSSTTVNDDSKNYVAWTFSKVANYFDIVRYTGNYQYRLIPHNLGVKPGLIMVKKASSSDSWAVYHSALGPNKYMKLNTDSPVTEDFYKFTTEPTATDFSVADDIATNGDGDEFVAYLFAEDTPGLVKCGSYTGNRGTNSINCGFEAQWVMIKGIESSRDWHIFDAKRPNTGIKANEPDPEITWTNAFRFTPTGFEVEGSFSSINNDEEYTYIAIAAPPSGPSGTVSSITDTTATLSSSAGTWANGFDVTTGDKTISGTVAGVVDTTATLSSSTGAFIDGLDVTGPQKTIVDQNARLYCAFDSNGNITDLQNNPQDPPYTTQDSNPGLTFTFPETFPSGQAPDDELPEGTTFTVEVTAENSTSTSGPVSATVQPEPFVPPSEGPVGLTTLYTGTNAELTITNGIDLESNGGLVWMKCLDARQNNCLYDTERGAGHLLVSGLPTHELTMDPWQGLTSFNSNGFSLGTSYYGENSHEVSMAAWTFGKAEGYFDVVTYTGSIQPKDIPHSLSVKPGMIIVKSVTQDESWRVYHSAEGATKFGTLNSDNKFLPATSIWNDTEPTDTDFTVGNDNSINNSGATYMAYLFAEDTPGVIKCGSYTSGAAPKKITTGFPVNWVLIKDATGNNGNYDWIIFDKVRGVGNELYPNNDSKEQNWPASLISFDSDGFTLGSGGEVNDSVGNTYIYVAIAEPPAARSQTNEEFVETTAKFISYDNRRDIKVGEEAKGERSDLITEAENLGLTKDQITKLFND